MDLDPLELMRRHRSVRKYKKVPLDPALIRECVAAAQGAATSSHVQAYSLLQVTNPAKRKRLAQLASDQPQITEAGAFFVLCGEQKRHRLVAKARGESYEPNLETFLVAIIDASLFIQNLVLAFESRGLGTCYIGALREDLMGVRELLELPEDVFPLFGLCAGEMEDPSETKPRLSPDAILHVDHYPTDERVLEQIANHDLVMADYYRQRGLQGRDWSGGLVRRFRQPNRTDLLEFYTQQGARLR